MQLIQKEKVKSGVKLFYIWIFLYFFTASADLLNVPVGLFKLKAGHIIAAMLFVYYTLAQRVLIFDRRLTAPFALLFISMLISLIFSPMPFRSVGYIGVYLINFFCYFLLPFNLLLHFNEKKILNLYWLSLFCVGLYAVIQVALSAIGIRDPFIRQWIGTLARAHAFTYEPSYYALVMTPLVMFYNFKLLLEPFQKKDIFPFLGMNSLLLLSTSTAGFFSYFIFLGVILYVRCRSYMKIYLMSFLEPFFVLLLLLSTLMMPILKRYFLKFFYVGWFVHLSFLARWKGLVAAWKVFLKYPLFGVGLGGIGPYLYREAHGGDISLKDLPFKAYEGFEPTNAFTELLGSLGLLGLFSFTFLAWRFLGLFRHVIRDEFEEKKTLLGLWIVLVVMLLELQFNQGLFRHYVWIHAAITYAYSFKRERYLEYSSSESVIK